MIDWESIRPTNENLAYPWREIVEADDYGLYDRPQVTSMIDIGANAGFFMLKVLEHWPECVVLGYEADPINAALGNDNLERFGFKRAICNAAIFDTEGEVDVEVGHGGMSHLPARGIIPGPVSDNSVKVSATTINHVMRSFSDIDFLKVDIEGSEFAMFRAATPETMQKFVYIAMELHDWYGPEWRNELLDKIRLHHDITQLPEGSGILKAVRR